MTSKLENDIKSMGYRLIDNRYNFWGKPVGSHLLIINSDTLEITNKFKGLDGKIHVWNSETLDREDLVRSIKAFEMYTKFRVGSFDTDFNFLTQEEFYESILR